MIEQLIFNTRMRIASLRQRLRDSNEWLTEDERNAILDLIIKLTRLLEELEKKKNQ